MRGSRHGHGMDRLGMELFRLLVEWAIPVKGKRQHVKAREMREASQTPVVARILNCIEPGLGATQAIVLAGPAGGANTQTIKDHPAALLLRLGLTAWDPQKGAANTTQRGA